MLALIAVDVPYATESREWLRAYARDTPRERFRQKAIYLKFVGPIGHLIGAGIVGSTLPDFWRCAPNFVLDSAFIRGVTG